MVARIKGAAFREMIAWLGRDLGQAELDAIATRVPSPHRQAFERGSPQLGILAASWYEAGTVHALLEAMTIGRSEREVQRIVDDGTRAMIETTLTGVHRAILRVVGSPDLHARFGQRLWSTYYEDGRVTSVLSCVTRGGGECTHLVEWG